MMTKDMISDDKFPLREGGGAAGCAGVWIDDYVPADGDVVDVMAPDTVAVTSYDTLSPIGDPMLNPVTTAPNTYLRRLAAVEAATLARERGVSEI